MATFTFPGAGVHDYGQALELFGDWMDKAGHKYLEVRTTIPELHPGGHGYHLHVLHTNRPNRRQLAAMRLSWSRYLQRRGHAEPGQTVRVHLKYFGSARQAGEYAAKYVAKALKEGHTPPGRHRYSTSRDAATPPPTRSYFNTWRSATAWAQLPGRVRYWFNGYAEGSPYLIVEHGPP